MVMSTFLYNYKTTSGGSAMTFDFSTITTNTKTVLQEKFSGIVVIVEKSNVMAEPPLVVL
jgi:hypothetical protein